VKEMEESYLFLQNEIKTGDTIVAGISGGPDSMAVLHLLLRLRSIKKINIICGHVNHNVRSESKDEAVNLEKYCNINNIIFEMMKIEEYSGDNFENEARNIRYSFFEKLIKKYNGNYLVTAHHGDDLMETILMRIVRGSTFEGYAGFSKIVDKQSYKILRPLINVTKEDIIKYNHMNNIDYAIDSSNLTDEHTRNRYRKYVLPFLKKENSKAHEKFLKFSQKILEYNEYIDIEMKRIINNIYIDNKLYVDKFLELDKVMQEKIINFVMEKTYFDDLMLITDVHTALIINLIKSSKPNIYIYLPNNIKVIKAYNVVTFIKEEGNHQDYKIELTSNVNLPDGKNIEIIEDNDEKSNYICRLNSKELSMPLYVRNKQDGDKMEVKGLGGQKKVKDIFINEKISMSDRDKWPILVDNNGKILWLPGLKKSKYDKSKKESYDIIIRYY
jgi:tRNA(Ile)-lysidine synthase